MQVSSRMSPAQVNSGYVRLNKEQVTVTLPGQRRRANSSNREQYQEWYVKLWISHYFMEWPPWLYHSQNVTLQHSQPWISDRTTQRNTHLTKQHDPDMKNNRQTVVAQPLRKISGHRFIAHEHRWQSFLYLYSGKKQKVFFQFQVFRPSAQTIFSQRQTAPLRRLLCWCRDRCHRTTRCRSCALDDT